MPKRALQKVSIAFFILDFHFNQTFLILYQISDAESALLRLKSIVPDVFFREDFHLYDEDVFKLICEPGLIAPSIQQEKVKFQLIHFSWHLLNNLFGARLEIAIALFGSSGS